jgi:hypothetical protein
MLHQWTIANIKNNYYVIVLLCYFNKQEQTTALQKQHPSFCQASLQKFKAHAAPVKILSRTHRFDF